MTEPRSSEEPASQRFDEVVPDALAGERVDRFLSLLIDISRREATELVSTGRVTVDGIAPTKPAERLEAGVRVIAEVPHREQGIQPDSDVKVDVIFEDDHVLVVNKEAGLIVHPGSGVTTGTMVQGLLARFPELEGVGDDPVRPGIVHRLDKGTSGVLMVAKTPDAFRSLSGQLAARTVLRRYMALVWGEVASDEGVVDAPLGRSPRDATRQAVVADGRPARTRYEVLQRFPEPGATFMECRLETGRTHQIRVHLEAIGHPVVGDARYGRGRPAISLARPFLHAATLAFEHPATGELHSFEADLPSDLQEVLDSLS